MQPNKLVLAVLVIGYLATCTLRGNNYPTTKSQSQAPVIVLRPVPATLTEEIHRDADATEIEIKGKAGSPFEFTRAQFINENCGWIMSANSLYKTTDGGNSWQRLPQNPEEDARFTSFFFVDESHGWLAIWKQIFAQRYGLGNSSVIMVTDDGGISWKSQASFPNEVGIWEVRFLNNNEGLVTGAKTIGSRPPYYELFVLSTSNGGREWKDISEEAKASIKNDDGIANDSGEHIHWTTSSLLLLTRYGRVISTADGGKTWQAIASFKDERPNGFVSSTGYYKLLLDPAQKLRVLAGGTGDEGYWGDFVVNEDGRWTSYEVGLTPIHDAVFLSNKEVIASGLNVRPGDEKSKRLKDAGVILRSFDGGKSWESIYRSKTFETFFFITRIKDNLFYAVSDTGTFLRFTLPQ